MTINLFEASAFLIAGSVVLGLAIILWRWKPAVEQTIPIAPSPEVKRQHELQFASPAVQIDFPKLGEIKDQNDPIAKFIIEKRGGESYIAALKKAQYVTSKPAVELTEPKVNATV